MTATQLETELRQFSGTENYYKQWTGEFVYTDGVKYVADKYGAYWLLDVIASWQVEEKVKKELFQVWQLTVQGNRGIVEMFDGDTKTAIAKQIIPYTDFPCLIKLYLTDGVLLLPSEY